MRKTKKIKKPDSLNLLRIISYKKKKTKRHKDDIRWIYSCSATTGYDNVWVGSHEDANCAHKNGLELFFMNNCCGDVMYNTRLTSAREKQFPGMSGRGNLAQEAIKKYFGNV